MPSISLNKVRALSCGVLVALAISGCARPAPDLPPDYGSVDSKTPLTADQFSAQDLALSCTQARQQQVELTDEASRLTGVIDDSKGYNEAIGILGALFIVPALAADQNPDEKRRLDEIQTRWDTLVALRRYKSCTT